MNSITQQIPGLVDCKTRGFVKFASLQSLLKIPWITIYTEMDRFHRFSIARIPHSGVLHGIGETCQFELMLELDKGKEYYVIGYLKNDVPELPAWSPK